MGHLPKYETLLLDSLIVFITRELPTCAEGPGKTFIYIGAAKRNIKIDEVATAQYFGSPSRPLENVIQSAAIS